MAHQTRRVTAGQQNALSFLPVVFSLSPPPHRRTRLLCPGARAVLGSAGRGDPGPFGGASCLDVPPLLTCPCPRKAVKLGWEADVETLSA